MTSSYQRFVGLVLSVGLGLVMVILLQSSLAWASDAAGGTALSLAARDMAGARWRPPAAPDAPAVTLTKTVGVASSDCAATASITLPVSATAYYCYRIRNTGSVTLSTHSLVDDRLGTILIDFPFVLAPGASAFLTQAVVITQTVVNSATWTAVGSNALIRAADSDQATVTVVPLAIVLTKTVGLLPGECASTSHLGVAGSGPVTYCYTIRNTGQYTLTRHDLVDNRLGPILTNFPFTLAPGASAFLTETAVITSTTVNTATWTARTAYSVLTTTASSSARVLIVVDKSYLPMIRK